MERLLSVLLTFAALLLVGILLHQRFETQASAPHTSDRPAPTYLPEWREYLRDGHWIGPVDADVIVIEFSDFQCPFCKRFAENFATLKEEMDDGIALYYIHFALTNHRFARPAAGAAECAAEQGYFSEFHDLLFQKQDSLGLKAWGSYASEAGVPDSTSFLTCLESPTAMRRVDAGRDLGEQLGATGTPTLLINGWLIRGGLTESELTSMVETIVAGDEPRFNTR